MRKQTDISKQIRKYLDGELDARAMHELERRAQDDPFLMDALEGYENNPVDSEGGLSSLQSRLQQRVGQKEARIIPWRMMGIAASILLLLGIGLFWYEEHSSPSVMMKRIVTLAPPVDASKPVQKKTPAGSDSTANPVNKGKLIASNTKRVPKRVEYMPATVAADAEAVAMPPVMKELQAPNNHAVFKSGDTSNMPLDEMIVMDYTAKKKSNGLLNEVRIGSAADSVSILSDKAPAGLMKIDTGKYKGNVVRIKGTDLASANNEQYGYNSPAASQYQNIQRNYTTKQEYNVYASKIATRPDLSAPAGSVGRAPIAKRSSGAGGFSPFNPVIVHGKMVKGMIKNAGEPVAYATVKIKGTNISTLTDAKGRFTLYAVPDSAILQVTADGYMLKEAKVTRRDMQVIAIHQAANTLNDAAAQANDNNLTDNSSARPSTGWDDFDGYLRHNAISPDGKKGTVELSFKVNADNSLSDFKVIKSVSQQTDNAAIKLVKDGPVWYSAADNRVQAVTINIKFRVRGK